MIDIADVLGKGQNAFGRINYNPSNSRLLFQALQPPNTIMGNQQTEGAEGKPLILAKTLLCVTDQKVSPSLWDPGSVAKHARAVLPLVEHLPALSFSLLRRPPSLLLLVVVVCLGIAEGRSPVHHPSLDRHTAAAAAVGWWWRCCSKWIALPQAGVLVASVIRSTSKRRWSKVGSNVEGPHRTAE